MTLAISHREKNVAVLDLVREIKPPFTPENTVRDFAADLRRYRMSKVIGDNWGGEFVKEPFLRHGIVYEKV